MDLTADFIQQYHRAVIHHELFHFLDYSLTGDIHEDLAWERLNIQGFKYGEYATNNIYERFDSNVTSRFPGFITRYSMYSIPEDKAELFAKMMTNLHEMECRARDDVILYRKMDHIKKVLKGFSEDMGDQFWERVRYLPRPRLTLKGKEDPWADAHPVLPTLPKLVEPVVVKKMIKCIPLKRQTLPCYRRWRCCH